MDYKPLYYHLFNAVTDALERLTYCDMMEAKEILQKAQQETEEMYLNAVPDAWEYDE